MDFVASIAETFHITQFDVVIFGIMFVVSCIFYYSLPLHRIFGAAFGAMVGLGVYVLLSVLLIGNPILGAQGGLFPLGFSVFLVSVALYLPFLLAVLFPVHGGLVISEPTQPTLYTIIYFFVSLFLLFVMGAIVIYMIEQSYVFRVGNIFTWMRESPFYLSTIKTSWYYAYVMSHQYAIIPLWVVLMLYKLLLANIVTAALLSVWYNLANVWFYRKKEESHYRVEFHEVWGSHDTWWHQDHGHGDAHSDNAASSLHDSHWHH